MAVSSPSLPIPSLPITLGQIAFPVAILLSVLYAAHGWYAQRQALRQAAKVRSEESRSPPRRGRTLVRTKSGLGLDLHAQLGGELSSGVGAEAKEESPFPDLKDLKVSDQDRRQVQEDKELYYKLQNLEDHPGAVQLARQRLSSLLDQTLSAALSSPTSTADSILSVSSPSGLEAYFSAAHSSNAAKYQSYLVRRKRGCPRELFPTRDFAVNWLRLAAVVKYVDGVWVGNALNVGMAPVLAQSEKTANESEVGGQAIGAKIERDAAKLAWQVISEEFGDGDLRKNHVYVYHQLLSALSGTGSSPGGDRVAFDGLAADGGSPRCWSAAVAQQCIGLLASTSSADFFPESLGFNMAYETLPYHLLVTSYELRELGVDDYYFALHITIDNPDSGHAAMARMAVETFLEGVEKRDGREAMERMWRRVQAGVVLADGLPTTPSAPVEFGWDERVNRWRPKGSIAPAASTSPPVPSSAPLAPSAVESQMVALLQRKARASEHLHCPSRLLIAGQTLEQWLEPSSFSTDKALAFLRALGDKRPWIIKGDSTRSRLVRELEWGGRMFGAFTEKEVGVVRGWIKGLGDQAEGVAEDAGEKALKGTYERFIGGPLGHFDASAEIAQKAEDEDGAVKARSNGRRAKGRFTAAVSDLLPSPSNVLAPADLDALVARFSPTDLPSVLSTYSLPALNTVPQQYRAAILLTSISTLDLFPLHPSKFATPLGSTVLRVLRSIHGFPALHAEENICAGTDEDQLRGLWEVAVEAFEGMPDTLLALAQAIDTDANANDAQGQKCDAATARRVSDLCADILAIRLHPYKLHATLLRFVQSALSAWDEAVSHSSSTEDADVVRRIRREVDAAVKEWEVAQM